MDEIPFLKPLIVPKEAFQDYMEQIDNSRIYSNNGPLNQRLEKQIMEQYFSNDGDAVTVNNATTGLMLAIAHTKRQGKYAIMPSFTFPATPLSALWCGLEPYYIDINPDTWCMDEERLKEALEKLGDKAAVVVPYAAFGVPMRLDFYEVLLQRQIPVVIDAASSFGSTEEIQFGQGFRGAVVFSFHATKSFGIGEGGLIYSGDSGLIKRLRRASNFGFDSGRESRNFGLNGKISEYTAAIGLATLEVFREKIAIRTQIASWYRDALAKYRLLESGWKSQCSEHKIAYQFYPLLCPSGKTNTYFVQKLEAAGIQVRTYFSPPCHRQELFRHHSHTGLSVTDEVSQRMLSLPVWEDIRREQIQRIVRCLSDG
ncbi:DegT/DnrJ/EryC1/StrS family aminotransferase [Paenibacillus pinihumi]|uniref:DegT/DnrJ/EryC1/StrS family aminotransferase n=1 Tax=Paenibacillus pinihumi TaxID=669462 RepID=UPI0003F9046F|nr:aminotransferase class I/II-fold pyridoxal phosphate-dependent enzyme [Paenibacillus pinihumi]